MSHDFVARITRVAAVASTLLVAASGLGLAQQKKDAPPASKGDAPQAERASGVILKVEKIGKGAEADVKAGKADGKAGPDFVLLRLSINTNDVWRDWARDQAQSRDEGPAKKDAAKGTNSIATQGQPVDQNSLVVVDVSAGTRVETRFRSPTDETSLGETSPDKVKSDEATSSTAPAAGKAVQFRAVDLMPGLFVEVQYRQAGTGEKNAATSVTVIRPISVLDASPAAQPGSK